MSVTEFVSTTREMLLQFIRIHFPVHIVDVAAAGGGAGGAAEGNLEGPLDEDGIVATLAIVNDRRRREREDLNDKQQQHPPVNPKP